MSAAPLEEKLAAFQKALQEKGNNNASKYDVLWNVEKVIASVPKVCSVSRLQSGNEERGMRKG